MKNFVRPVNHFFHCSNGSVLRSTYERTCMYFVADVEEKYVTACCSSFTSCVRRGNHLDSPIDLKRYQSVKEKSSSFTSNSEEKHLITMGKKAKSAAGQNKALMRKVDKSALPPPPCSPEEEVCEIR